MNVKVILRKGEDMEDMSQCKDVLFFFIEHVVEVVLQPWAVIKTIE